MLRKPFDQGVLCLNVYKGGSLNVLGQNDFNWITWVDDCVVWRPCDSMICCNVFKVFSSSGKGMPGPLSMAIFWSCVVCWGSAEVDEVEAVTIFVSSMGMSGVWLGDTLLTCSTTVIAGGVFPEDRQIVKTQFFLHYLQCRRLDPYQWNYYNNMYPWHNKYVTLRPARNRGCEYVTGFAIWKGLFVVRVMEQWLLWTASDCFFPLQGNLYWLYLQSRKLKLAIFTNI